MANRTKMIDTLLQLKDAGLVASTAAATVDGAAAVIDTGGGYTEGKIQIDITAIEVASTDEAYYIVLQGSNTADMSAGCVALVTLSTGCDSVIGADSDTTTGRYIIGFNNLADGTLYRYLRLYTVVVGTVATGINYVAYMTK